MSLRRLFDGVECQRFGADVTDVTTGSVTKGRRNHPVTDVTDDAVTRLEAENADLRSQISGLRKQLAEALLKPLATKHASEALGRLTVEERKARNAAKVAEWRKRQKAG